MSSVNTIRLDGNNCTHTQKTGLVSEQDVQNCIDCLFNMYASIFVLYFKKYEFGANNEIMSAFSILPPIVRYLALNELHQQFPENLSIIDKLSLVLLKAFDKDQAIGWIEDRKEMLSQVLPYTEEAIEKIISTHGENVAQQAIDNAPDNMYDLCLERIIEVEKIISRNGLLYNNFEQAKQLYLEKGILLGDRVEIQEFNSIMEFVYLGRKEELNSNLEKLDS